MASPLRILTVVGARPQIIKAAALSRAVLGPFRGRIEQQLLHTGQHYDANMSDVFFQELGVPAPAVHLGVGAGTHGAQTARMIDGLERTLINERPDLVLVYGDTNSTLAAALAAVKLGIPLAHVEAGLRSFDKRMPEEVNRVLCDHCSTWLFCPTTTGVGNLRREGIDGTNARPTVDLPNVVLSGDVMFDNSMHFARLAQERSSVLRDLGLEAGGFLLATIHRDRNTDDPARLGRLIQALVDLARQSGSPVVLPLHPRTRKQLGSIANKGLLDLLSGEPRLRVIDPVGFLDMIELERHARLVLTDSGGVQKEAFFFGRPCIVLRDSTEWVELLQCGQAVLCDADPERILQEAERFLAQGSPALPSVFGDGHAAERICESLLAQA
ncbi:MAG: UDP-N-acetylglucosamine 2-epimerase (non-hydrolyzing) [Flavobacteriales bacterium]|jgi:UDP-GlcNAc3NAcA epimerase|nr:UDP-N-acetylglucosamine 2-epimerase (non-hydrolyzing) [Flavobacteriales bacterium]MBK7753402.1 UDP-N-acetylglucosamine 2-epimerase (non-hydrolyzing) [Flavobacteriales bacterium]MBK9077163.1 UDP-N-acetylglucosamine 2-epimerase (non-hydrolyzing) [Flavobacteriales bacterium]MBK9538582.1 UDP-N-acetylglucosamine 2-epimerase (non-hydrolyzing) [Flavobacteriales bacterium]